MKLNGIVFLAAVLVLSTGIAAAPQITSYTVSPDRLKAGMSGTINIVFTNPSATEYLSGVTLEAGSSQLVFNGPTSLGDMGNLGTTVSSLGFSVKDDAAPGIYTTTLTMGYATNFGASSGYKKFSIPVTIYPDVLFQFKDFQSDKSVVNPGDSFEVSAKLTSRGGELRHVTLEFAADSNFTLEDATKVDVGTLQKDAETPIKFRVIVKENAKTGYYSIPMTISYDDAVSTSNTGEVTFGPITVATETSSISIAAVDNSFNPGSQSKLRLELRNEAGSPLENVRVTLPDTSDFFVPLDFTDKTIGLISSKGSQIVEFAIGIKTNVAPQVYQIPITVRYESKTLGSKEYVKNVGVIVAGTPLVAIIASTSPAPMTATRGEYTLSVQVSNVGNAAIRAVSTHVSTGVLDFVGTHEDYLGTLNLDDYSTSQYSVVVKPGVKPGIYPLNVTIVYKDAYNKMYSQAILTDLEIVSADFAALTAKAQPTNPLYIVIGLAVLAALLYFGYKKFFHKKKVVQ